MLNIVSALGLIMVLLLAFHFLCSLPCRRDVPPSVSGEADKFASLSSFMITRLLNSVFIRLGVRFGGG